MFDGEAPPQAKGGPTLAELMAPIPADEPLPLVVIEEPREEPRAFVRNDDGFHSPAARQRAAASEARRVRVWTLAEVRPDDVEEGAIVYVADWCTFCKPLERRFDSKPVRSRGWTLGEDPDDPFRLVSLGNDEAEFLLPRIEYVVDGEVVDEVVGYPEDTPDAFADLIRRHPDHRAEATRSSTGPRPGETVVTTTVRRTSSPYYASALANCTVGRSAFIQSTTPTVPVYSSANCTVGRSAFVQSAPVYSYSSSPIVYSSPTVYSSPAYSSQPSFGGGVRYDRRAFGPFGLFGTASSYQASGQAAFAQPYQRCVGGVCY